ncbi:hypothetical protein GH733_014324 [Mirounga leonina]|nr:hypothetical protein GH733_014324 [Mirounga leonina]
MSWSQQILASHIVSSNVYKAISHTFSHQSPARGCYRRGQNSTEVQSVASGAQLPPLNPNPRETAKAIKGLQIRKATEYLKDVTLQKQGVPFHRYNGGVAGKEAPDEYAGEEAGQVFLLSSSQSKFFRNPHCFLGHFQDTCSSAMNLSLYAPCLVTIVEADDGQSRNSPSIRAAADNFKPLSSFLSLHFPPSDSPLVASVGPSGALRGPFWCPWPYEVTDHWTAALRLHGHLCPLMGTLHPTPKGSQMLCGGFVPCSQVLVLKERCI